MAYPVDQGERKHKNNTLGLGRAVELTAWLIGGTWGEDMMAADTKRRGVVEIPEDAYKQNTVYRPWKDIKASGALGKPESPLHRPQWPSNRR